MAIFDRVNIVDDTYKTASVRENSNALMLD